MSGENVTSPRAVTDDQLMRIKICDSTAISQWAIQTGGNRNKGELLQNLFQLLQEKGKRGQKDRGGLFVLHAATAPQQLC